MNQAFYLWERCFIHGDPAYEMGDSVEGVAYYPMHDRRIHGSALFTNIDDPLIMHNRHGSKGDPPWSWQLEKS